MKLIGETGFTLLLAAFTCLAGPRGSAHPQTFTGKISDSMCGLKHMMAGKTDKECTVECVQMGDKYVLADEAHQKVYNLSDQAKPKAFAGQQVKVVGTLQGDTIQVTSIRATH